MARKKAQNYSTDWDKTFKYLDERKKKVKKTDPFKIGDKVKAINLPEKVKAYLTEGQPMIDNPYNNREGIVTHYQTNDVRVKFDNGYEDGFLEENLIKVFDEREGSLKEQIQKEFPNIKEEEFDGHESDLYIKHTPAREKWLKEHLEFPKNLKFFTDNIDKELWIEIPFEREDYAKGGYIKEINKISQHEFRKDYNELSDIDKNFVDDAYASIQSSKYMATGGLTEGNSHADGGIPLKVKSTGQNIEVEGGEGIINKKSMSDPAKHNFDGKELSNCEVISEINTQKGQGVSMDCDTIEGREYQKGGSTNSQVAEIIIQQLGGINKIKTMTGAYNFATDGKNLTFKIKNKKVNYIKITLNPNDLYDLEFGRLRFGKLGEAKYTIVKEYEDMGSDQLIPYFEKNTGMYLRLEKGGETYKDEGGYIEYLNEIGDSYDYEDDKWIIGGENRADEYWGKFGDAMKEHDPIAFEVGYNDWQRESGQYADGGLTPAKAQQMLDEGVANGNPLTEKQKRYFHSVASGKKSSYADGGVHELDEEYYNELRKKGIDRYSYEASQLWKQKYKERYSKLKKGGEINRKYLDRISKEKKATILNSIAKHYGTTTVTIHDEVIDKDAELLYEYIGNNAPLRMEVYKDIESNKYQDGGKTDYYIFEGFDHYNNVPLYQVSGRNNEYVGEWHKTKEPAQEELKELVEVENSYARGGKVSDEIIKIKINYKGKDYPSYLKQIDSTHFYMSNSESGVEKVIPSHIQQHIGENYYSDVHSWLKGGANPHGKSYESTYAKGGKILAQNDIQIGMIIPNKKYPKFQDKVISVTDKAVKIQSANPSENYMGSKFGYGMKPYTYRWDGTGYKRQSQYLHSDGIYRIDAYADGGEVEKESVNEVIKEIVGDMVEENLSSNEVSESIQEWKEEEVETKSRDGFIAFLDGGVTYTGFGDMSSINGSGEQMPTESSQKEFERQVENAYEMAKDQFKEDNPELVKELGEDKINYFDLNEAGKEDEAEELSEKEYEYMDDTIMYQLSVYYYDEDNNEIETGENTITISGSVNLESPYHRRGNNEDYKETTFTFSDLDDLKEKLTKETEDIIDWLQGGQFSTSEKRELKFSRWEKGGVLKELKDLKKSGHLDLSDLHLGTISTQTLPNYKSVSIRLKSLKNDGILDISDSNIEIIAHKFSNDYLLGGNLHPLPPEVQYQGGGTSTKQNLQLFLVQGLNAEETSQIINSNSITDVKPFKKGGDTNGRWIRTKGNVNEGAFLEEAKKRRKSPQGWMKKALSFPTRDSFKSDTAYEKYAGSKKGSKEIELRKQAQMVKNMGNYQKGGNVDAHKNLLWDYLKDTAFNIEKGDKNIYWVELQEDATLDEVAEKINSLKDVELIEGVTIPFPFKVEGYDADESRRRGKPTLRIVSTINQKFDEGGEIIEGWYYNEDGESENWVESQFTYPMDLDIDFQNIEKESDVIWERYLKHGGGYGKISDEKSPKLFEDDVEPAKILEGNLEDWLNKHTFWVDDDYSEWNNEVDGIKVGASIKEIIWNNLKEKIADSFGTTTPQDDTQLLKDRLVGLKIVVELGKNLDKKKKKLFQDRIKGIEIVLKHKPEVKKEAKIILKEKKGGSEKLSATKEINKLKEKRNKTSGSKERQKIQDKIDKLTDETNPDLHPSKKVREALEKKQGTKKGQKLFKLYEENEKINYHGANALMLVEKYGTKEDIKKIKEINRLHKKHGGLSYTQQTERDNIAQPYYVNLIRDAFGDKKAKEYEELI